jgi:hypothetical protein
MAEETSMTPARESLALTGVLAAATLVVVLSALSLGTTAGVVPLVVGIPTLSLLVLQLVADARTPAADFAPASADGPAPSLPQREAISLAWMAMLLVLVWAAGPLAGVPAFLFAYLRLRSREPWRIAVAVALAAWYVLYGGLGLLLDVQWWPGAVWEYLFRP